MKGKLGLFVEFAICETLVLYKKSWLLIHVHCMIYLNNSF